MAHSAMVTSTHAIDYLIGARRLAEGGWARAVSDFIVESTTLTRIYEAAPDA